VRSSVQKAILVVLAATALASILRGYRLSRPPEKMFDEVYYASDACWYTGEDYRACGLESDTHLSARRSSVGASTHSEIVRLAGVSLPQSLGR
jgi:hypothetical protein